jgi:hypothetical protein
MAMAGHKLTRDQDDYLAILSEMILHYDREHDQPRKRGTPHQRLRYLVKEAGMSASDLGRLLGNRGMGSVYLTGKRACQRRISASSQSTSRSGRITSFEAYSEGRTRAAVCAGHGDGGYPF